MGVERSEGMGEPDMPDLFVTDATSEWVRKASVDAELRRRDALFAEAVRLIDAALEDDRAEAIAFWRKYKEVPFRVDLDENGTVTVTAGNSMDGNTNVFVLTGSTPAGRDQLAHFATMILRACAKAGLP